MTDRKTASTITDAELDELYARLAALTPDEKAARLAKLDAFDEPDEDPADDTELTADEARTLVDDLGLQLYRAQDALDFVAECCAIADREHRAITTADVREWLKGAQCGRQLAADNPHLHEAITAMAAEQPARTTPNNPAKEPTP